MVVTVHERLNPDVKVYICKLLESLQNSIWCPIPIFSIWRPLTTRVRGWNDFAADNMIYSSMSCKYTSAGLHPQPHSPVSGTRKKQFGHKS